MGATAIVPLLPTEMQNEKYSRIQMPKIMPFHNYIGNSLVPWLYLHYPTNSSFNSRIFIGRKKNGKMCTVTRRNIDEILYFVPRMHISKNCDYYICANGVKGVERKKSELFSLHNIVIDIDCHVEGSPYELLINEFVARCKRDLFDIGEVPEPNSIVYTVRGVQFWWALEAASKALLWLYQRIQSWLMAQFEQLIDEYPSILSDLSVDTAASRNVVGYFRLPLTYNTAIQKKGSFTLLHTKRYKLTELVDQFVPADFNEKKPAKKMAQKQAAAVADKLSSVKITTKDVAVFEGGTSAMARRVLKMIELRALRNAPKEKETRDLLCFVVYCALLSIYEQDEAWRRLLTFNDGFKLPMPIDELEEIMASAEKNRYHLTNEWIIEKLKVSPQEQFAIGMVTSETNGKKCSNYTRDLLRRIKKDARNAEILALYAAGKSQTKIADEMGLSRNTVAKVLRESKALIPQGQETDEVPMIETDEPEEMIKENSQPEKAVQRLNILNSRQDKACSHLVRKFSFVSYKGLSKSPRDMDIPSKPPPGGRGRPPT